MIDDSFTIELYYINQSCNNSCYYHIQIDYEIYNGTMQSYKSMNFNYTNGKIISIILIKINNETILRANNIRVISNVNANGIKRTVSEYTINLSPFEWSKKEWNIFYSLVVSCFISMGISYRGLKYYRKKNGIKIIRG